MSKEKMSLPQRLSLVANTILNQLQRHYLLSLISSGHYFSLLVLYITLLSLKTNSMLSTYVELSGFPLLYIIVMEIYLEKVWI